MRATLAVPAPFSLRHTIASHGWLHAQPFHPAEDGTSLGRIETIRGRPREILVTEVGRDGANVRLSVRSDAPEGERAAVRRAVRKVLGLDEDLTGFYTLARRDPKLRGVLRFGVGRTVRGTSLWEDCVKGIAQTNIQWRQALVCIARICTLGDTHPASGLSAFPTPTQVLDAGPAWLRREARVGYRDEAIVRLAQEVEDGTRDLDDLERRAPTLTTGELIRELTTIRGIGPTTAHTLVSFLGKHDVVSVDSATIGYVRTHYPRAFRGGKPTPNEARAVFARYGEWSEKAWWYEAWLARHLNGRGDATTKKSPGTA